MEVINHQRRKTKIKAPDGYELDHIIPHAIGGSDTEENIQFLRIIIHKEKTKIDLKILKYFRKIGWTNKITNYSHELMVSKTKLREEYLKIYVLMSGMSRMSRISYSLRYRELS